MKVSVKKAIKYTLSIVVFLATIPAVSAIPYRNAFEEYEMINAQTKELNLSLLAKIQFMVEQNQFNMAKYVPLNNLPENDDGALISRRILKHTIQNWLDQAELSGGASNPVHGLVRQANSLNDTMAASIDRNGHKVSLRFKPVETSAEISYTGYVKAVLAYDVNSSEATMQVSKTAGEKTYSFTHVDNSNEVRDIASVSWSF